MMVTSDNQDKQMKPMLLVYTCNSMHYLSMTGKKEKTQRDQASQFGGKKKIHGF